MDFVASFKSKRLRFTVMLLVLHVCVGSQFMRAELISVAFKAHNPDLPNSPLISGPESAATAANSLFGAANDWNNLFAPLYTSLNVNPSWDNLVDSTGAATGVHLSITGTIGSADLTPYLLNPDPLRSALLFWNSWASGQFGRDPTESTSISWELSGLAANATFDMCVYGSVTDIDRSFNMTIGTSTKNVPTFNSANGPAPSCVLFSNITSNASGVISGIGAGNGDNATALNEANWSGFQLVQLPASSTAEPSTVLLLGIGIAGTVTSFRKRIRR